MSIFYGASNTTIVITIFITKVVPYTELCLEGIAIPLLGGAGILGNVAAVIVLRFSSLLVAIRIS